MFRGGPARFSAGEGPTKDRYGSQSKANSRSIRGRLCFPKVPVPSDHETPQGNALVDHWLCGKLRGLEPVWLLACRS
jgi:hypothetical protein